MPFVQSWVKTCKRSAVLAVGDFYEIGFLRGDLQENDVVASFAKGGDVRFKIVYSGSRIMRPIMLPTNIILLVTRHYHIIDIHVRTIELKKNPRSYLLNY